MRSPNSLVSRRRFERNQQFLRRLIENLPHPLTHVMVRFCKAFLLSYSNYNYDFATNGEQWVLRKIARFCPTVIFDVGANVGNWLIPALAALPGAHIHAFEIVEGTFAELYRRVGARPDVTANAFGLSASTGVLEMHLFEESDELASCVPYPHGDYKKHAFRVECGDEYLRRHAIDRIDFLKMDVEGAEHLVLHGFSKALDAGKIDAIQFEYGRVNILTHFLLIDFYNLLESKGYILGKIYPNRVDFRPYKLEDTACKEHLKIMPPGVL